MVLINLKAIDEQYRVDFPQYPLNRNSGLIRDMLSDLGLEDTLPPTIDVLSKIVPGTFEGYLFFTQEGFAYEPQEAPQSIDFESYLRFFATAFIMEDEVAMDRLAKLFEEDEREISFADFPGFKNMESLAQVSFCLRMRKKASLIPRYISETSVFTRDWLKRNAGSFPLDFYGKVPYFVRQDEAFNQEFLRKHQRLVWSNSPDYLDVEPLNFGDKTVLVEELLKRFGDFIEHEAFINLSLNLKNMINRVTNQGHLLVCPLEEGQYFITSFLNEAEPEEEDGLSNRISVQALSSNLLTDVEIKNNVGMTFQLRIEKGEVVRKVHRANGEKIQIILSTDSETNQKDIKKFQEGLIKTGLSPDVLEQIKSTGQFGWFYNRYNGNVEISPLKAASFKFRKSFPSFNYSLGSDRHYSSKPMNRIPELLYNNLSGSVVVRFDFDFTYDFTHKEFQIGNERFKIFNNEVVHDHLADKFYTYESFRENYKERNVIKQQIFRTDKYQIEVDFRTRTLKSLRKIDQDKIPEYLQFGLDGELLTLRSAHYDYYFDPVRQEERLVEKFEEYGLRVTSRGRFVSDQDISSDVGRIQPGQAKSVLTSRNGLLKRVYENQENRFIIGTYYLDRGFGTRWTYNLEGQLLSIESYDGLEWDEAKQEAQFANYFSNPPLIHLEKYDDQGLIREYFSSQLLIENVENGKVKLLNPLRPCPFLWVTKHY